MTGKGNKILTLDNIGGKENIILILGGNQNG